MEKFDFLCLGSLDCFPQKGNDSSNYLLNGHILIDTGWATVNNLLDNGIDPHNITHVVITHFHPDHYMGLNGLFFYFACHGWNLDELTVAGPAEDIERIVKKAADYWADDCFNGIYPKMIPVMPGDKFKIREIEFSSHRAIHPVSGLCYRVTNEEGCSIGFSGDTLYQESLAGFFKDCDLLVYENSYGPTPVTYTGNGHSSAYDAANTAIKANVKKLFIVHSRTAPERCLEACRTLYKGDLTFPKRGERYEI